MTIQENVPLSKFSTMKLGGPARYLTEVANRNDLTEAYNWALTNQVPMIVIGDGSNTFWADEGFEGLVIVNRILGFEITTEDESMAYVQVGAGENWDTVVARTVAKGLNGIAELSLIPGTAGATPVQNVGAYGQEISNVLVTIEVFDISKGEFSTMTASECDFSYRNSRFKTTDRSRYIITYVTLLLSKSKPQPPFYSAVGDYLKQHQISDYTPDAIRKAVIDIRMSKLPDPSKVPNSGSFFKNPIIDNDKLTVLRNQYPNIQYWSLEGGAKLSAAWLIEQAGFKDYHDEETGMATWRLQPLVIINEKATSTNQLLQFSQKIVRAVQEKFQVTLEQEPELLP